MTDNGKDKDKKSQWNPENMQAARTGVQQEGMMVSVAAKLHSAPRKTTDNIMGHVIHSNNLSLPLNRQPETMLRPPMYLLYKA